MKSVLLNVNRSFKSSPLVAMTLLLAFVIAVPLIIMLDPTDMISWVVGVLIGLASFYTCSP